MICELESAIRNGDGNSRVLQMFDVGSIYCMHRKAKPQHLACTIEVTTYR
jgi:hypothetical protein